MTPDDERELDRLLAAAAPATPDHVPSPDLRERIIESRTTRGRTFLARRGRPRVRRRRLGLVLAPGAVAGGVFLAVILGAGPQPSVVLETASAATIVLTRTADAGERAGDAPAGRFLFLREIENFGDGPVIFETWRRADGSTARSTITRRGRTRAAARKPSAGDALPWTGLTDREIVAMPVEPSLVVSMIRRGLARAQPSRTVAIPSPSGTTGAVPWPRGDRPVFNALMALHDVDLPLSAEQRAALLRAAATLSGVRSLGRVVDPLGRAGHAIAIDGDAAHEGYGRAHLLSPSTGEIIATLELRRGNTRVHGWLVRQRAIVNATTERPPVDIGALPPASYAFSVRG